MQGVLSRAGPRLGRAVALGVVVALAAGCAMTPVAEQPTVGAVDLARFMGHWYVIAAIPASAEAEAYNAVETYRLNDNGTIATTYRFRDGGFDGRVRCFHPKAFVRDTQTRAEWGMQFFWPIRLDYRVIYLDASYTVTMIGRNKRDHAWIMARSPSLAEERLEPLVEQLRAQGYPVEALRRVPHRWDAGGYASLPAAERCART